MLSWAALPPPVVVSCSILIQNWCKMLSWLPCLLLLWLLIQFLFKIDANWSSGCLASSCGGSLFNSYSKLMQIARLVAASSCGCFLIQFLCKTDTKCSSGCVASFGGGFSFSSYSKLMQTALLAALPPPGALRENDWFGSHWPYNILGCQIHWNSFGL